jgi:hypothetical protein
VLSSRFLPPSALPDSPPSSPRSIPHEPRQGSGLHDYSPLTHFSPSPSSSPDCDGAHHYHFGPPPPESSAPSNHSLEPSSYSPRHSGYHAQPVQYSSFSSATVHLPPYPSDVRGLLPSPRILPSFPTASSTGIYDGLFDSHTPTRPFQFPSPPAASFRSLQAHAPVRVDTRPPTRLQECHDHPHGCPGPSQATPVYSGVSAPSPSRPEHEERDGTMKVEDVEMPLLKQIALETPTVLRDDGRRKMVCTVSPESFPLASLCPGYILNRCPNFFPKTPGLH